MKTIRNLTLSKRLILGLISILSVVPLLFIFLGMTHSSEFVYNTIGKLYFGSEFLNNLSVLNENFDVIKVVLNSLLISILNASLGVSIMFLAGFAFAKYDFKGKNTLFVICLLAMMIPGNVIIINKFKVISILDMKNSYAGLVLPTVVNIHILLLFIRNFEYINNETIEAARIDGASELRIMFKVVLPAVLSYIIIGFFNMFVQSWNNFLLPLLIVNSEDYFTIPIMISSIADPMRFKFGAVFVGIFILITPVIILLISVSKYLFRKVN